MSDDRHESDVVILGMGIAGSVAALRLADAGLAVSVVTKAADPLESNTRYAQGGIVGDGIDDSAVFLGEDIQSASGQTSFAPAVEAVATEGPRLVREVLVDRLSIDFDREESGELHRTREAAHSRRRIFHARDATGYQIQRKLVEALRAHPKVTLFSDHMGVDLLTRSHHSVRPEAKYYENVCLGAYVLENSTGRVKNFFAPTVILATGGIGQVYLHTTNPKIATGDGLAMAARAGCRIINAEYVQFHPTALYHRDAERFLITEALRGEGARLVRGDGSPFMQDYDPQADLAPRDVVARAIHEELSKTGASCVFLDIARFAPDGLDIRERFPTIYEQCQKHGIDITREAIPVVPAAHYFCGGIQTDLQGRTSLPGLFAVGEVACTGLHGANRLASTSLLEGLVFGNRAAEVITGDRGRGRAELFAEIPAWDDRGLVEEEDLVLVNQDWIGIKYTMWNYAGLVRSAKRLTRARSDLEYLLHRVEKFYRETRLSRQLVELRNGLLTARLITYAALRNPVSSGCHYRKD